MSTQTSDKKVTNPTGKPKGTKNSKLNLLFGTYLNRIQKKSNSEVRLSKKALTTIDGMICQVVKEISEISGELLKKTGRKTLDIYLSFMQSYCHEPTM